MPHQDAHTRLTQALEQRGCRRDRPGSWQCPAHEDRHASLSVTPADGRVLVRCHAGCTIDQITHALNLTRRDLFDDTTTERDTTTRRGGASILETYPYVDEAGGLLFEVVRLAPKDFRQRRPDGAGGWSWSTRDVRRVPYRLPRVIKAAAAGDTIYIVEGEKDVHAVEQAGGVATTSPGGAGKWRSDYNPHFAGAHVVVVADNDQPGITHAETIRTNLTGIAATIRVVRAASGKDAADHLAEGHRLDAFIDLDQAAASTHPWAPLKDILTVAATPPQAPGILKTGGAGGLLYDGRRHLLSGEPETLKTWIAAAAAVEVITHHRGVIWWDADSMGVAPLVERLRSLGAQDNDIANHLHYIAPDQPLDAAGRTLVAGLITTKDVQLTVVDAFDPALELHAMSHKDGDDVQRFYRTVIDPFHAAGVATLIIDHVTKDRENRGRWSIGSQRKLAGCDVAFNVELHGEPMSRRNPKATIIINGGKDRPGWHHRSEGRRVGQWSVDLDNTAEPWKLTLGRPASEHASDGGFRPTFLMERVSRHLMVSPTGATKGHIENDVKGNRDGIRRALDVLVTEGYAHCIEGQRGALIYRHITLYTEANDERKKSESAMGEVVGEVGRRQGDLTPEEATSPTPRPTTSPNKTPANDDLAQTSPNLAQTPPPNPTTSPTPGGLPRRGNPVGEVNGRPEPDPDDWRRQLPIDHPEATP